MSDRLVSSQSEASSLLSVTPTTLMDLLVLSPDALIVVNQAGTITHANAQAQTLFGYREETLIGQPLEMLIPSRFHEKHILHREHYATIPHTRSMGASLELFGKRRDGSEFPVDVSLRPVLVEQYMHVISAVRDVTAQQIAERERTLQAERLRLQADLLNLSREAILTRDPISRVLSWSRGAERLYGWTAQEALGRVVHSLLKTRFPANRLTIEAQLERDGQWEGELVHARRDGSTVLVHSHQMLMRNDQGQITAILEVNQDITERQHLTEMAQQASASTAAQLTFFQRIVDSLPSSVYIVQGPEARLVLANRAVASIWGARWPTGQAMHDFLNAQGIQIVDTQGHALPPEQWATMRAVLHGETVRSHQEIIYQPGGLRLPVLAQAVPLVPQTAWPDTTDAKQETLALVIHQDVTSFKEAEHLKDEFVGIAAHELRAPLAVLKSAASMLCLQTARGHGPQLAEWQEEALQEIEQATDRLSDLTEDLLDVTRLQAGRTLIHPHQANIVSLVQRVVASMQPTATRHQLLVHTRLSALEVPIDASRIEQVLVNLVNNAIKYSPQGGIVEITIWEEPTPTTICISIRDEGIGIPQDQQSQIFGRFIRADNAHAAGIHGTGLGLYLCREFIEQHGGRIWFKSVEGKGSTFFLTLPEQGSLNDAETHSTSSEK